MNGTSVTIKAFDYAGRPARLTIGPAPGADGKTKVRIIIGNTLAYVDTEDLSAAIVWLYGQTDAGGTGKHGRTKG